MPVHGIVNVSTKLRQAQTEPTTFAGIIQQVFMTALVAAHTRESFSEIAAPYELVDHFWNHPAQHALARLIVARP